MMNNIILIGMMGSGKSTIAKALRVKLAYDVFDTDDAIEKKTGNTISEIFKAKGEVYFRQLENTMCKGLGLHNNIISTGGGIILNSENVKLLKEKGPIIYLSGTIDTLLNRLINETENRPLISKNELQQQLTNILNNRKELYENAADIIVKIDDKDIDTISNEIIMNLREIGYKF